ncbi:hypothetical protein FJ364_01740 [Candidatus Dependentiae bacterium]|nr:hypothetical protein [Candidatus Dependentiae bacterium]
METNIRCDHCGEVMSVASVTLGIYQQHKESFLSTIKDFMVLVNQAHLCIEMYEKVASCFKTRGLIDESLTLVANLVDFQCPKCGMLRKWVSNSTFNQKAPLLSSQLDALVGKIKTEKSNLLKLLEQINQSASKQEAESKLSAYSHDEMLLYKILIYKKIDLFSKLIEEIKQTIDAIRINESITKTFGYWSSVMTIYLLSTKTDSRYQNLIGSLQRELDMLLGELDKIETKLSLLEKKKISINQQKKKLQLEELNKLQIEQTFLRIQIMMIKLQFDTVIQQIQTTEKQLEVPAIAAL